MDERTSSSLQQVGDSTPRTMFRALIAFPSRVWNTHLQDPQGGRTLRLKLAEGAPGAPRGSQPTRTQHSFFALFRLRSDVLPPMNERMLRDIGLKVNPAGCGYLAVEYRSYLTEC